MSLYKGTLALTFSFSLLSPFSSSPLSPNTLHLVVFTSWLPAQRAPEERLPSATEPGRQWSMVRRMLTAGLLFSLLLGFSLLLVYIFRSCGPGKQDSGISQPSQPFLIRGSICLPSILRLCATDILTTQSCLTLSLLPTSRLPPPNPAPGPVLLTGSLSPFSPGIPLPSPLGEPCPFLSPSLLLPVLSFSPQAPV